MNYRLPLYNGGLVNDCLWCALYVTNYSQAMVLRNLGVEERRKQSFPIQSSTAWKNILMSNFACSFLPYIQELGNSTKACKKELKLHPTEKKKPKIKQWPLMLLCVATPMCAVRSQESRSTHSCPERSQSTYQSRCSGWKKVDDSGHRLYSNSDKRVCSEMTIHVVISVTYGHKFNQWETFSVCTIEAL